MGASEAYAFDFEVAAEAAARWRRQRDARKRKLKAVDAGRYGDAESPERMAARVNHLVDQVRSKAVIDTRGLSLDVGALVDRAPVSPQEVDDVLFERVIGQSRDFLSTEFLSRGVRRSRAVGRVVTRLNGRVSYGTGFLVSPSLLLTNHHVLTSRDDAAGSEVEFDFAMEEERPLAVQRFKLEPERFFINHKPLDYALVAVAPLSAGGGALSEFGFCRLVGREGKISIGESANIIQHPRGEMRQVVVRENGVVDLRTKPSDDPGIDDFIFYEGDTERGSSGSAVFNDQWEVVALHHSAVPDTNDKGQWLDRDGQVWSKGDDPERIRWIANEGIRISRLLKHVGAARVQGAQKPLLDEFLERPKRLRNGGGGALGPAPEPREAAAPQGSSEPAPAYRGSEIAGEVVIELAGVTITVRGAGAAVTSGSARGSGGEAVLEELRLDPDYEGRPGFQPEFCGFAAPLPKPDGALKRQVLLTANGGGSELKYHHFSAVMHAERRLAIVSAVNFWTEAPHHFERPEGDRWVFDPRVERERQAGGALYSRNPLDRGHLARRADAAWGETMEEAELANNDTFHWTNCAPQHEIFNQSGKASKEGLRLWGNLENLVAEQAGETEGRFSVFNGPIFRSDDARHRGVQVPREYWKAIAFKDRDGQARVLAFVLSQADRIADLPVEAFEVGEFRPFQLQLSKLEARVDLNFGDLWKCDPLSQDGNEAFFEGGSSVVPIRGKADLVL